jgi:hypothetical protein
VDDIVLGDTQELKGPGIQLAYILLTKQNYTLQSKLILNWVTGGLTSHHHEQNFNTLM